MIASPNGSVSFVSASLEIFDIRTQVHDDTDAICHDITVTLDEGAVQESKSDAENAWAT